MEGLDTLRLQKYMAYCGVGSRRKCEELIKQGCVTVNGIKVTEMGLLIDPDKDKVVLNGKQVLKMEKEKHYIIFYKPQGIITSVKDPYGRKTVMDYMNWQGSRIYPVGRLDYDTEGLLLLTNDGDLALKMTHPKYEVEKEYYCIVKGVPNERKIEKLKSGINIGNFITAPAKVALLEKQRELSILRLTIHEGKNRQVRRMFQAIGHPILYLRRERIGNLTLDGLKIGEWRNLTKKEIYNLKKHIREVNNDTI
jgi:23S rRNA pseudouridine2605 synthase